MTNKPQSGKHHYRDHLRQAWQKSSWQERPKQFSNDYIHGWNLIEEILNSITHGAGAIFGLIALALIIVKTLPDSSSWPLISGTIFGLSIVAAFSISTVYHAVLYPPPKKILKTLDHCSIFALIAGTYTPFCLVTLREGWGWSIFTIIWGCALLGIMLKLFYTNHFKYTSLALYLIMGWFAGAISYQLIPHVPTEGLVLLLAGGLFYTFGVIFFIFEQVPFFHTIWHLFVLGGAVSHFLAIFIYALPQA